jgi:hypothetical protein
VAQQERERGLDGVGLVVAQTPQDLGEPLPAAAQLGGEPPALIGGRGRCRASTTASGRRSRGVSTVISAVRWASTRIGARVALMSVGAR